MIKKEKYVDQRTQTGFCQPLKNLKMYLHIYASFYKNIRKTNE